MDLTLAATIFDFCLRATMTLNLAKSPRFLRASLRASLRAQEEDFQACMKFAMSEARSDKELSQM